MPKTGFSSITVRDKMYQFFWNDWNKNKEDWQMEGINSFTAYMIKLMSEAKAAREKK